jgi:hypothetical protein
MTNIQPTLISKIIDKWFCLHKWELYQRTNAFSKGYQRPSRVEDTLVCKRCGKIKKISL